MVYNAASAAGVIPINKTILFRVADIDFSIRCPVSSSLAFSELLNSFRSDGSPQYFLDVDLQSEGDGLPVVISKRYSASECKKFISVKRLDARRLQAVIKVEHRDIASAVIGYLLSLALSGNHGMIVHASAFVSKGRSFVFVGPSGAGKTTIVRNTTSKGYVHDDRVAIRRISGNWKMFGVPMCDNNKRPGANVSEQLKELYFLVKGHQLRKTRMSGRSALPLLGAQAIVPFDNHDLRLHVCKSLLDAIFRLNCYRLWFPRDCDVISFLSGEM